MGRWRYCPGRTQSRRPRGRQIGAAELPLHPQEPRATGKGRKTKPQLQPLIWSHFAKNRSRVTGGQRKRNEDRGAWRLGEVRRVPQRWGEWEEWKGKGREEQHQSVSHC